MNIYPILPYVYMGVHKVSGKIYIGSRTAKSQKIQSHIEFGSKYRTSSKYVKPIFDEFDWHIVAEFFDPKDAYNFEQLLIYEQWQVSKQMSLNHICYHEKKSWNNINISPSKETKCKMSDAKKDIPLTEEHKRNIGNANRGKPKPPRSEEHSRKIGDSLTGRQSSLRGKSRKPNSKEQNRKIGDSLRGKTRPTMTESHKQNIKESRRFEHSFLTPYGFVIENITMKELCSQFNLNYGSIIKYFRENKLYKGFRKL